MPEPKIHIQYTSDLSTQQGVKCILYGPTSVGKTRLCATAPAPFYISSEKGLLSIRSTRIPYFNVNNFVQFHDFYNWLIGSREAQQFQTFCFDSLTDLAEICLNSEKGATKDGRKAYGEMQDRIYDLMRKCRDVVGPNMVFICQEEKIRDEQSGASFYAPAMPGNKLPQKLPYFVDEVFQLQGFRDSSGNSYSALRTDFDLQSVAKDRSGTLDYWEKPDLTHVFNKIKQGHVIR